METEVDDDVVRPSGKHDPDRVAVRHGHEGGRSRSAVVASACSARGISTDGVKTPPGLREGSSENAAVATALLADLVERGLDVEQGVLVVLDGSQAPCESMIEYVRRSSRKVKHLAEWRHGHCAGPPLGCSKPSADSAA